MSQYAIINKKGEVVSITPKKPLVLKPGFSIFVVPEGTDISKMNIPRSAFTLVRPGGPPVVAASKDAMGQTPYDEDEEESLF
jgi:hypothetical protein